MERSPVHSRQEGLLQTVLLAVVLMAASSGADAADPFVTADNPFQSGWKSLTGTAPALGLARTARGLEVVVNADGAYGNALTPILRDPPNDLTAVCLVTMDEHGSNRFRLLGATPVWS